MSESAAQAREWWESRTENITKHASNCMCYIPIVTVCTIYL